MPAKYIIRLDDASEYMDFKKWTPFFEIFDHYGIRPIVAVIPLNMDPKLIHDYADMNFWEKVKNWQNKGYRIALHGCEHLYRTSKSGIIGMNKRSEFAGVALDQQKHLLRQGIQKFAEEGIAPEIFVAPAHSFDKNTLIALKEVTNIRIISDGFYIHPVRRLGLNWIPQQLWEPEIKSKGVWTICCHPEITEPSTFDKIHQFIKAHNNAFADPLTLRFGGRRPNDILYFQYRKNYFRIKNIYHAMRTRGSCPQTNLHSS